VVEALAYPVEPSVAVEVVEALVGPGFAGIVGIRLA
jgi:hypothetical protein